MLSWAAAVVPSQWYKGDLALLLVGLANRLAILPELIQLDREKSWQITSQRSEDVTLRLSDSGTHDVSTSDARNSIHRGIATACA